MGAGLGLTHVGGFRRSLPPPPLLSLLLGRRAASRSPESLTPKPEDSAPSAAVAFRRSHDITVLFGCAKPPQVPPVRVLTLTLGRAGSSAPSLPGASAQPFQTAPLRRSWNPPFPQSAWSTPRDTWRGNLGPPFLHPLP